MKKFTQVTLLIWFVVINLFIFIPSFVVLLRGLSAGSIAVPEMPQPPPPPEPAALLPFDSKLDASVQEAQVKAQVDAYTQRINSYTQRVAAYGQQIVAYKSQIESGKTRQMIVYQAVVVDTLKSLLTTLLSALVGFVFAKAGAEALSKYMAAKKGQPLSEEIELL
jgi:hypothetical protein